MDLTDLEQENRRDILKRWVDEHGGHAEVVRRRKLTPAQASFLSQVINGYSFGARAARGMEERLGLPARFLEGDGAPRLGGGSVIEPPLFQDVHISNGGR